MYAVYNGVVEDCSLQTAVYAPGSTPPPATSNSTNGSSSATAAAEAAEAAAAFLDDLLCPSGLAAAAQCQRMNTLYSQSLNTRCVGARLTPPPGNGSCRACAELSVVPP